jgi:putative ABC transport system permease protein
MVRLAGRMLRQRPASGLATLISVWFAVTVVAACGVLLESGIRYHGTPQRYAAADVLVARPDLRVASGHGDDREVEEGPLPVRGRLNRSLVARLTGLPGVRSAVADSATPVGVGSGARAELHPWPAAALAPFRLRAGTAPASRHDVVLDARLPGRIGATIRLTTPRGRASFRVSGIVAGRPGVAPTVFVTSSEAAATGAPVGVIGLLTRPGVSSATLADTVRAALPRVPAAADGAFPGVYSGSGRGLVESPAAADGRELAIALSSVFGGCTLLIAVIVIAGTVGLSVRQRVRDLALLRAIAATPRQVRRMVVREAALLALLATGPGLVAGRFGAYWLRDQFVDRGLTPSDFTVRSSWLPPAVAAAAGLLIAVGAAWVASVRASRIRPVEALGEASVEPRPIGLPRLLLGLAALTGGVSLSIVAMHLSSDAAAGVGVAIVATFVTATAFLAPLIIRAGVVTVGIVLRRFGVCGRLAVAHTAAAARRLAPVLTALVLAVGLGGSLWFLQTSIEHRAVQQNRAGLLADHVVTGPALPAGIGPQLRAVPGVSAATGITRGALLDRKDPGDRYPVQGVDLAGVTDTMDLDVARGRITDLAADTVAIDQLTADSLGLHVGDELHAWFGDGTPANLRVAAIYNRGLGFAAMTLAAPVLRAHSPGFDDAVLIRTDNPAALGRAVARLAPGARVVGRRGYQAVLDSDVKQSGWTSEVVIAVLLVYVVIAAVNTLISAALARRRELASLRLAGTTRRQITRMVQLEQGVLLSIALGMGTAIAAATLLPMVRGSTGSAVPYIPPAGWAAVIGGTVLLGFAATMAPTRAVLRDNPVAAIGVRE